MIVKRNFARIVRRVAIASVIVFLIYEFSLYYYDSRQQKITEQHEEIKHIIKQGPILQNSFGCLRTLCAISIPIKHRVHTVGCLSNKNRIRKLPLLVQKK